MLKQVIFNENEYGMIWLFFSKYLHQYVTKKRILSSIKNNVIEFHFIFVFTRLTGNFSGEKKGKKPDTIC